MMAAARRNVPAFPGCSPLRAATCNARAFPGLLSNMAKAPMLPAAAGPLGLARPGRDVGGAFSRPNSSSPKTRRAALFHVKRSLRDGALAHLGHVGNRGHLGCGRSTGIGEGLAPAVRSAAASLPLQAIGLAEFHVKRSALAAAAIAMPTTQTRVGFATGRTAIGVAENMGEAHQCPAVLKPRRGVT